MDDRKIKKMDCNGWNVTSISDSQEALRYSENEPGFGPRKIDENSENLFFYLPKIMKAQR